MPLVIGGPDVAFCQDSEYLKSLYLPVLGRCFSNRPSSFSTAPPVTVLVVVFWMPMPISSVVCALTCSGASEIAAASSKEEKPSLDAANLIGQILSNRATQ